MGLLVGLVPDFMDLPDSIFDLSNTLVIMALKDLFLLQCQLVCLGPVLP